MIEDLHWVDDASGELVNHLVRAAATRAVGGRHDQASRGHLGDGQPAPSRHHASNWQPLTDDDIRRVAIEASPAPLADATLDLIVERSQGNPLFALELTRAAGRGEGAQLPDSVEKVISSRIDELGPGLRRLVRVAAVFGNSFDVDDLAPVLEQIAAAAGIDDPGLAEIIEHRSGATWAFRHALYRDAAYEGLPFRQRQNLHGAVANSLEQRASDPSSIAGLLSLHFHEARDRAKTWHYSLIAGRKAEAQYALAEAAATYQRALAASSGVKTLDNHQRATVAEALGDALVALGRYEDANAIYQRARRYNDDPTRSIHLMRKLGVLHERSGDLTAAIRWFGRARREAQALPRRREVRIAQAQVDLADAGVRFRRGDYRRCQEIAGEALRRAADTGDRRTEALALDRLHVSTVYLNQPDNDHFGQRAVEAFDELGDLASKSRVLNNQGIEAYFGGRWSDAAALYEASMREGIAAGSVVEASLAALNSGEILSDQGRWDLAHELLGDALRNWEAAGYATGIAAAHLFIGVTQFRQGDRAAARASLDEAATRLAALGLEELVDDAASWLLELNVLDGSAGTSETGQLLGKLGPQHRLRSRVVRTHARALHLAGKASTASELLRVELAKATGFERARTLQLLSAIQPEAPELTAWQDEIADIHEQLGIVATPDPLRRVRVASNGLDS